MTVTAAGKGFRDLIVWQRSMNLVARIYELTAHLPKHELYCLTSQIRRCAVSISSNIAEGSKRGTRKDFRQFILIAYGSSAELETQIDIARRLQYLAAGSVLPILEEISAIQRMLHKLSHSLHQEKPTNE